MRPLLAALLGAVAVLASCDTESFEANANSIPFAGSPRGYGINFPELIKIYYTGLVQLWNGRIDIANEQFDGGRSVFIPISDPSVVQTLATNFDVKVSYYNYNVNFRSAPIVSTAENSSSPLLQRHPELSRQSTPRVIVLNTSHPGLSSTFKSMTQVRGNFRVRLGEVETCHYNFIPFAEFGFSTLPWREPGTIKLLNITPSASTFPDWPRTLALAYSASIAIHDIRQMRYEVTPLDNPKDTKIYPFDKLTPFYWQREVGEIGDRRLLAKAVAPTPETPCLSFCEENPMSEACHACCTGVLHEKPWNCGEGSQVKCCTDWTPDCWDTPSERNLLHSCNLCQSDNVRSYQFPGWMYIQDNVLTIDHEYLSYDLDYLDLRKVLLRSNVLVKLVIGRGAIVDGFSHAQLTVPDTRSFRIARPANKVKLSNALAGRAVRKLPETINLTIPVPATWRCPTDVRGFGIRHPDLAGGQVMRPGDLCRMRVAIDDPPPYDLQPSTSSPTQAPTTAYPTEAPTTSPTRLPTAAPTPPTTAAPTGSPTTPAPTASPTTRAPTQAPSTPRPTTAFPTTASPTAAPTVSPTVALYAPRDIECDGDEYWPQECPFPQYLQLVVENNVTTLAVDTTDDMFKQDFPDLDRVRGQVTVTVDPASLVTADGTSTPIEAPSEDPFFVIAPLNSDGLGVALTKGGLTINVGRNTVIIPAGTISDTAVVNASIVTPQLPDNIPAPISDVIRILVFNDNDTIAEIQDLQVPVQMILPIPEIEQQVTKKWSPCRKQVYYHDATCVWWNEATNDWSTGGCVTDNRNSSETSCFCNHLTDFAVLQALESCQEVDPLPYQVFAGPFFCIFLYCLWALGMLAWYKRDSKKPGFGPLAGQHVLMAIAAMARALGPLAVLPGATAGTASALFAIPYLAKFPSFLLLVFQWATIVHFTMQTGGGRRYMMPAFAVSCVLIDLAVAALFIYFHVTEEVAAVLAGTITLAALAFLYSIAFLGYAFSLARQFPKEASNNSKSGGSTTGKSKRAGLRFRVQTGGVCFAILFMLEAACHPAALYLQQQNVQYGLLGATSVFLLAEFLSFCVILWLFYPALSSFFMPRMTTTEVELERNNSTRKSAATVSTAANSVA